MAWYVKVLVSISAICLCLAGCSSPAPLTKSSESTVQISNLGPLVNSPQDDFAPTLTANGAYLYFTSSRPAPSGSGGQDFWCAAITGEHRDAPVNLGSTVNTPMNEGASSISADGQKLYFAACSRSGGQSSCDIYVARREGKDWADFTRIGPPVSTEAWESQPCISADGRVLYFASDRPGGLGGIDIWRAEQDSAGSWRRVTNLGAPINTKKDDLTPVIASDGTTLYFASNGHPGLGGTDLFVSYFNGNTWSQPRNLGAPINSSDNDEFLALDAEGSKLIFASVRKGGLGGLDLYEATPNPSPPGAVLVVSGVVLDAATRQPIKADIVVVDSSSGRTLTRQLSNAYSGEYLVVLPAGRQYRIEASATNYKPSNVWVDTRTFKTYQEERRDIFLSSGTSAPEFAVTVTADVLRSDFSLLSGAQSTPGLTIEEVVQRTSTPLLPYIFFAENSADMPNRYAQSKAENIDRFSMDRLPRATLDIYHCILDIVGHRMRETPAAKLTVTGLEAGVDRTAPRNLPTRRAQSVRDYLIYAWRIDPSRISIAERVEPVTSYGMTQEQVVQEARRVELSSTDPYILDPITRIDTVHTMRPPRAVFLPSIQADAGLRDWELTVSNDVGLSKHWKGTSLIPDSIFWDWRGSDGSAPSSAGTLKFQLHASDMHGDTRESETGHIPVRSITLEQKVLQRLPDRTLETVSLILFDLDKATLSDRHREMLANTMLHIETGSTLLIRGYTDALGETEYNFSLAGRRAEAVRGVFAKKMPSSSMRVESMGESVLLYPNDLPEGRFYCRTVQVSIETLVQR